jgi:hypothetical protein
MFKKTLAVTTIAAASMLGVAPAAQAGGSPGILNEVFVPVCAPNVAILGAVIPVGTTTTHCPTKQNG